MCWSWPLIPSASPPSCWQIPSISSRTDVPGFPGGYIVAGASDRAVTGSACPGRERLKEQPVLSLCNLLSISKTET